ncbi:MAG: hypothetical protein LBS87_02985 [Puniceicoccales bacterium]|nr:hypothetical protein [Puniceicoccales bacterium]
MSTDTELDQRSVNVVGQNAKALFDRLEQNSQQTPRFLKALLNFFRDLLERWDQAQSGSADADLLRKYLDKMDGISDASFQNICQSDQGTVESFTGAVKDFLVQNGRSLDQATVDACKKVMKKIEEAEEVQLNAQFIAGTPDGQKAPADAVLSKRRPDMADKIKRNGKIDLSQRKSFENADGLPPAYLDSGYDHDKLCEVVTEALFSDNQTEQDEAVDKLLNNLPAHCFVKDGIGRCEVPDMQLPNGIQVISNRGGGKRFREETGGNEKKYDGKEYTKYILNQFREAYGDKALPAFLVYMQNFTGSGNSLTCFGLIPRSYMADDPNLCTFVINLVSAAGRDVKMEMDGNFNATYEMVFDMTTESCREAVAELVSTSVPPGYDENSSIVAAVKSSIPAAHNPDGKSVYEKYDQRGQRGKQKTHMTFLASFGPKPMGKPR